MSDERETGKPRLLHRESRDAQTVTVVAAGQTLGGRYELVREIGRGSMGVVFEARDQNLEGLRVAIKLLPPELSGDAKAKARMRREALAALKLTHTNILRLNAFEDTDQQVYLVMEFLDGKTLNEVTAEQPTLPLDQVLAIARDVCPALDYAHRNGVIHRDIKPSNLVYHHDGGRQLVKIADFGIAYVVKDSMSRLTGTEPAGTLLYMAPEHLRGDKPGPQCDQYSLAATLYELLAGDPPFTGTGLSHRIMNAAPLALPGLADHVNAALLRALAKEPAQRFETCESFLVALEGRAVAAAVPTSVVPPTAPPIPVMVAVAPPAPQLAPVPAPVAAGGSRVWMIVAGVLLLVALRGRQSVETVVDRPPAPASIPAADEGVAEEQFRRGCAYDKGEGVPQDLAAAAKWYRKAADHGLAIAQFNLGVSYASGAGVPKDPAAAVQWYRKAADQGDASAQFSLGACYADGAGVPKDPAAAVRWYRKAADQGNADAQCNLGICYKAGEGVPADFSAAAQWYRKAAAQGHAQAQMNLGVCYANGRGVPKDPAAAALWYRKAADQGLATAQNNLGACYASGEGVPKDCVAAAQWYRKAADQGHASAQFNLGDCYAGGAGVPKDPAAAAKWLRKAADQGNASALSRLAP